MEDARIVDLYWQRSDEAIPRTEAKFGRYCRSVALRILGDELDAEECVNDTWLAAWNSMPDNRPAKLCPYLGKITRNFALTRLSERTAQKRGGGRQALVFEELRECISGKGDPEREAEARETAAFVSAFRTELAELIKEI